MFIIVVVWGLLCSCRRICNIHTRNKARPHYQCRINMHTLLYIYIFLHNGSSVGCPGRDAAHAHPLFRRRPICEISRRKSRLIRNNVLPPRLLPESNKKSSDEIIKDYRKKQGTSPITSLALVVRKKCISKQNKNYFTPKSAYIRLIMARI